MDLSKIFGAGKGYRTHAVGIVLIVNMIYTLLTGDAAPTFDDPGSIPPGIAEVGGGVGAGLMTLRSAIAQLGKRLDAVLAALTPKQP